MKKIATLVLVLLSALLVNAQSNLGVGTNAPDASAKLDITSTDKGILIPRMTTTARTAITTPAKGLMVYDSTLKAFYYHDGTAWNAVGGGSLPSQTGNAGKYLKTDGTTATWATAPGVVIDLIATKNDAQTLKTTQNAVNTAIDSISFTNVTTTPTIGTWSTTTATYTVGASGLYYIEALILCSDHPTMISQTIAPWAYLEINGAGWNSASGTTNVYGDFITSPAQFNYYPSGLRAKGRFNTMVYLTAGSTFKIKGGAGSTSQTTITRNDNSTRLIVVKMN